MEINEDIFLKNASPIIDDEQIIFVYKGSAQTVFLTGDYNSWKLEDSMSQFKGGNVWYIEKHFPVNARFDYKFVADGNWITDAMNANTSVVGTNTNSTLIMPEYKSDYENIIAARAREGRLVKDLKLKSAYMNAQMTYHLYIPPDSEAPLKKGGVRHILYALDGSDYINYARINTVLDYMIYNNEIPKLVAVLVDPLDRTRDFMLHRPFNKYIVEELMPAVENECMSGSFERSAAGVSWGGLTALCLAVSKPYPFSSVLSQSGSYWPKDWRIFDIVAQALTPQIKFVIQTGTVEDTEEMNDAMTELLKEKGYSVAYDKYAETHSWYNWRGHLGEGLRKLF